MRTSFHHQPEAQQLQAGRPITPSFGGKADILMLRWSFSAFGPKEDIGCALHELFQSLAKHLFQGMQCCPLSLGTDMPRREFTMLVGGSRAACGARAAADE